MTLVWFAIGGLVVVVAVVVGAGMLMPERYEGRSQAVYDQPVSEIWEALLDYENHPMTGTMMQGVESQPDFEGLPVWVEDMGRGERITVRTVEAIRPDRMVREMASSGVPMTSRWEYTLEPLDNGCRLTIEAETFIRTGTWHVPIFRVMMVLGGGVKRGLDVQMNMIAATLASDD